MTELQVSELKGLPETPPPFLIFLKPLLITFSTIDQS